MTVNWILWAILLVVQNAAFTVVSRARNSPSIMYHGIASAFSNGVWFVSQCLLVVNVFGSLMKEGQKDWPVIIAAGLWYTAWTMFGSLTSHWIVMKFVEPWIEKKKEA